MTRRTTYAALGLASLAILVPARGMADVLAGAGATAPDNLVLGVWLFKGLLLLHAALLGALGRVRPGEEEGPRLRRPLELPETGQVGERILLGALLVGAAALRLHDLGAGLWFDEIVTLVQYVRLPFGRLISSFDSQNQHLLFSVLARGAVSVLGEGAVALRMPAVGFGVASIWAVWWLGRIVAGRSEALLAAAFLTFSYHHVWFSQDARGYTGLLFFTLVGSGLLLKLLDVRESGGRALSGLYAIVMALAVYTHLTAVLVVIAHGIIWLSTGARGRGPAGRRAFRLTGVGLLLTATLSLQLYAFVLPQIVGTLTEPTMEGVQVAWKNPAWLVAETVTGLAKALPGGLAGLAAAALVGFAGLVGFWRRSRAVTAVLVLPAVVTAAAILVTGHNLWPRFFFFSAGAAALIVMRGLFVLWDGVRRFASARGRDFGEAAPTWAGVALIAASAWSLPAVWGPKQDYEGARAWVEARRDTGDAVATVDMTDLPYGEYLEAGWSSISDVADLGRLEASHPKTWILYSFPTRLAAVRPEVWERLEQDYRKAAEFPGTVRGGTIVVLVKERT